MLTLFPNTAAALGRNTAFGRLARDMDRIFESALSPSESNARQAWPGLNVWRENDQLVAEAEIPGFRMEDIELYATEDTLTLRGRRDVREPEGAEAIRVERSVNSFERSLRLPVEINPDSVEATLVNGVLRVNLPLAEASLPKRVHIQGGANVQESEKVEVQNEHGTAD